MNLMCEGPNTPHLSPLPQGERKRTAGLSERCAKEMCHSAERTHFDFYHLSIYETYLQELMSFAVRFANGFVLENEPICRDNDIAASRAASAALGLTGIFNACYRRFLAKDRPDEVFR
jgi:hypothetical protein